MKKAIVVASGGLDSCVSIACALKAEYSVALLHVNYGQRTEKKELAAFNSIAEYYGIKEKMIVDIGYLKEIGGSSLTDENIAVETGGLDQSKIPSTYVPFRNANILSIATSWAEVIKAEKIYIGAVEEDSSGYPDCREIFFEKFNDMLSVALPSESRVKIETPLIKLKKSEIVSLGVALKAPLHLSWSCYQNEDEACGVCDSCRLRLKGFKELGLQDPIKYIL